MLESNGAWILGPVAKPQKTRPPHPATVQGWRELLDVSTLRWNQQAQQRPWFLSARGLLPVNASLRQEGIYYLQLFLARCRLNRSLVLWHRKRLSCLFPRVLVVYQGSLRHSKTYHPKSARLVAKRMEWKCLDGDHLRALAFQSRCSSRGLPSYRCASCLQRRSQVLSTRARWAPESHV